MFTASLLGPLVNVFDGCPWGASAGRPALLPKRRGRQLRRALYSTEERKRRDASRWTLVQGVLAPVQFGVFLISLGLVLHYLMTGNGLSAATFSIVVKTLVLYTIMITGSIWETRGVRPLPVRAGVLLGRRGQHAGAGAAHRLSRRRCSPARSTAGQLMLLALAAYATYVVNAAQFMLKLRAARLRRALAGPLTAARSSASR